MCRPTACAIRAATLRCPCAGWKPFCPAREWAVWWPGRWMEAFRPGGGMGGAGSHWNGHTWRWAGYDPTLRTHYAQRYGSKAIASTMPLQDWGVTYEEME